MTTADDDDHFRHSGSRRPAWRRWSIWAPVLTGVLAFVPRALTAGTHHTVDEVTWMRRSFNFSEAIRTGDFASASATTDGLATMPGVVTMWLGTLARLVWGAGHRLGLIDNADPYRLSQEAIHLTQLAAAVATSVLVGILVALLWRWAGPTPAVAAGAILATEPFLVAHGTVLHTDELAALFGVAGLIALLLALDWPSPVIGRKRLMAVAAGVLLAGAVLTKLSALAIAPGAVVVVGGVVAWRVLDHRRDGRPVAPVLTSAGTVLAIVAAVAVAVTVATWPAIWADTGRQIELMRQSASMADAGHLSYFRGEITETPGPTFYAVTTPMRMTPWFLVAAVVLAPLALARRWWGHSIPLVVVAAPAVYVLSTAAKQFDRYIILVLPYLAIAVGIGLAVVVHAALRRRHDLHAPARAVGAVLAAAAGVHAALVAPWGLIYYNPLLGGVEQAKQTMLVGWGEGLELAGERIAEREAPDCDITIAVNYFNMQPSFPCGDTVPVTEDADYLVLYVNQRQRLTEEELADMRARGRLVDTVTVHGVDYAEIYDLRGASDEPSGAVTRS